MGEPYRLTASGARDQIRLGALTVEDYAKSLLSRISRRDSIVRAWAHFDPDFVLKQARDLDQIPAEQRGPLHGVAVGVKDVIYTKGVALCHSPHLATFLPGKETDLSQICRLSTTRQYIRIALLV